MAGSGALPAAFRSLAEDAAQAGEDIGRSMGRWFADTAGIEDGNVARTLAADSENARALRAIRPDADTGTAGDPAGRADPGQPGLDDETGTSSGQQSEGNGATSTAGDPVGIVSGQMLMSAVDLELPGVLPLVLRRAYASGYRAGRLFGPGWSGTLDQRVQVDDDGIRFAGDDAQVLRYPLPGMAGGAVLPAAGARWPLSWDRAAGVIAVGDPGRGWTWHFDLAAGTGRLGAVGGSGKRDLTRITDRSGNAVAIRRDADGLPVEVAHSGGYRVAVDRARDWRVQGRRAAAGRQ